jgi:tetratricopeptide (TPR) repeat protein
MSATNLISNEKRAAIWCLLLVAATLAFYNPVAGNQFTDFDDSVYILKNPQVQSGLSWQTLKWSFTTFHAGYWHPVTWLSHAFDCQIFRLDPAGHHYINLLLHAANVVLLFLLLQCATGLTWPSLTVAALFALHPLNVESVAWVAERKNVLSMLFFLIALHLYDRYARTEKRKLFWWVTVCFALGLMAKPQIVTLPFVLLLWDYWPLRRIGEWASSENPDPGAVDISLTAPVPSSFGFLLWEKWPLFVLAAADSVITVIAQRAGAAVRTVNEVPLAARFENAVVSYARYLEKAVWPARLAPMYPHPGSSLPVWQVIAAAGLLLVVTGLVLVYRQHRYLFVGWFWFLGTLVPMIGLVTVGEQAMADRFAYVPLIGILIASVWGIREMVADYRIPRLYPAAAGVVVVVVLGCLTYRQLGYWRNDETLWRYTLSVTERNYMAHDNLAIALSKQGKTDEAVGEFRSAEALHRYPAVQVLALASYELSVGHPAEALDDFSSVLRIAPDRKVRAAAWSGVGQAHLQMREYDQANESYQNALQLNPDDGTALMGAGVLALRQGQSDVAVAELAHALQVDPNDLKAVLLMQALKRAGRTADADSLAAQVRKISSDPAQAQVAAEHVLSFAGLKPL